MHRFRFRKSQVTPIKGGLAIAAAVMAASAASHVHAAQLGSIFYIAMENHDFTQGAANPPPQQIFNNPAAPFQNSLITPGNPNAAMVSYASNYTNAGTGVHPSEPNYIWAESGTNLNPADPAHPLGVHTDADPSVAAGNVLSVPHLGGLMDAAGVTWKNYQEDVQVSGNGALHSSSGTLPGGATNPYYGTGQYNYAVKHNPYAFFNDATATENVNPLSQLTTDLNTNTVAKYNWITPNQYNDSHSALSTDFTYAGQTWPGNHAPNTFAQYDQEAIALGDNFLSKIIPQIEASAAFQNNGAIVIWYDESENGDTTTQTIPEIVISPLAKGNAYNSILPYNHSSDIKTMQEVFGLPYNNGFLNNAIPGAEYSPAGGPGTVNTVTNSNDLSDLFQSGVIPAASTVPEPSSVALLGVTGLIALRRKRRA